MRDAFRRGIFVQGKPRPPQLKTTEFPDGTGTIGLPPGWIIDGSYRGACGCKGPNRAAVLMGMGWMVMTPGNELDAFTGKKSAVAPLGDLPRALREVLAANGSRLITLRSRRAPSAMPGVPAVNFLYDYDSKGMIFSALGYYSMIGDDPSQSYWQLYSSAVAAPKERFIQELPTLTAIYASWKPNGQKPKAGSNGAMIDAVIEANRKMNDENMKSQRESFDRMNAQFRQVL